MKFYTYGDKSSPLIVMLPGSFCPAKALDYLYDKLQSDFYLLVCEYNGHYENSSFTSRQGEAEEIAQYLIKNHITSVKMIYAQSMGAEIGIELMHRLIEKRIAVEKTFLDGAPCIRLSRPYKAFMKVQFTRDYTG